MVISSCILLPDNFSETCIGSREVDVVPPWMNQYLSGLISSPYLLLSFLLFKSFRLVFYSFKLEFKLFLARYMEPESDLRVLDNIDRLNLVSI